MTLFYQGDYTVSMAAKKKIGFTLIAILAFIIIFLIIFLVKLDDIKYSLKTTGFFTHVFGSEPEFIQNYTPEETLENLNTPVDTNKNPLVFKNEEDLSPVEQQEVTPIDFDNLLNTENEMNQENALTQDITETDTPNTENTEDVAAVAIVEPKAVETTETDTPNTGDSEDVAAVAIVEPQAVETTEARLFFAEVDSNGSIFRYEEKRSVPKTNSPLTTTINELLLGPSQSDINHRSFIPEGTKLLGASVKNGVATLNFSEEFQYNVYGIEGARTQLMQVVYTASVFPTVKSVQILIDGEKKEYLGSEGVWIGTPLTTGNFR